MSNPPPIIPTPPLIQDSRLFIETIKVNCHNSRTSHDIDMKLGPVTKQDNRNKKTSKNFDDDVMSGNCDVSIFFRLLEIWGKSGSLIPAV